MKYLHTPAAHATTQYLYVAATTCLTAVHISQGGEPCIAVLVHGSRALYVRVAQGQTKRGELKRHHRGPSPFVLSLRRVTYYHLTSFHL